MATVKWKKKFICADVQDNHYKYWVGIVYEDGTCGAVWGRVGKTEESEDYPDRNESYINKKINEKLKKGYKEVNILDTEGGVVKSSAVSTSKVELKQIAKNQIEHTSSEVGKLIEYLVEENRHDIYSATGGKIAWNSVKGMFTTPLGIVTSDTIKEARTVLTNLADYVNDKKWSDKKFISQLEQYLLLIPQEIGMKFIPENILPDLNSIQKQNSILDSLEASYQASIAAPNQDKQDDKKDAPKVFDVKLNLIDDKTFVKKIHDLYFKTRDRMHSCYSLNPNKIYSVDIKVMHDSFLNYGSKMQNIWELWHGSSSSNCLSILKKGFIIPPAGSPHVTGRMFGDGIYGSDISTKALNYSYGYWGGQRSRRYFMFLCDFAMGNYHTPSGPRNSHPPAGYDSYYAKSGRSSVMNNEMIVFKTSQVNIKYMVEFG